jgi:hypothetical protein
MRAAFTQKDTNIFLGSTMSWLCHLKEMTELLCVSVSSSVRITPCLLLLVERISERCMQCLEQHLAYGVCGAML